MKYTPILALAAPALLAVWACGAEQRKGAEPDRSRPAEAPQAVPVSGQVLYGGDTLGRPQAIGIVGEWLLVGDVPRPSALHVISRSDGRPLASWGGEGQGPGEFSSLWSIHPAAQPDHAWLFDAGQNRLTLVDVGALATGSGPPLRRTVGLRDALSTGAVWLSDTLLVSTGLFTRGRLAHFDSTGAAGRLVGPLPQAGQNVPAVVAQHAYTGTLVRHPRRPLVALGTRHSDRVEIYTAEGELRMFAHGPRRFEPVFDVRVRAGSPVMGTGDDLRFGYVDLAAAGDRLYALYSGNTRAERPGRAYLGGEVHVFDWDGTLRQIVAVDVPAIALAVDGGGRTMYTVAHDPEPAVRRYDLPAP